MQIYCNVILRDFFFFFFLLLWLFTHTFCLLQLVTQFQGPLSTLSHEEPRLDIMDGASSSAFHFQCLLEDLQATGMGFSELHCSSDEMDNKYVGFVDKVTHPSEPVPFSAQCSTSLKDIMSMYDYRSEFPQIKDVYKPDIDNIKDSIPVSYTHLTLPTIMVV